MSAKIVMFEIYKSTWLLKSHRFIEMMIINLVQGNELIMSLVNAIRQVAKMTCGFNSTINLI